MSGISEIRNAVTQISPALYRIQSLKAWRLETYSLKGDNQKRD
jgi:hypothetical protein